MTQKTADILSIYVLPVVVVAAFFTFLGVVFYMATHVGDNL